MFRTTDQPANPSRTYSITCCPSCFPTADRHLAAAGWVSWHPTGAEPTDSLVCDHCHAAA